MDEITHKALLMVAAKYPKAAIRFTHQFLDGYEGKACGLVPDDWDGSIVTLTGQWYRQC